MNKLIKLITGILAAAVLLTGCLEDIVTDPEEEGIGLPGRPAFAISLPQKVTGEMVVEFIDVSDPSSPVTFTQSIADVDLVEAGYSVAPGEYNIKVYVRNASGILLYYGETEDSVIIDSNADVRIEMALVHATDGRIILRNKIYYVVYGEVYFEGVPVADGVAVSASIGGVEQDSTVTSADGTFQMLVDSANAGAEVSVAAVMGYCEGTSLVANLIAGNNYVLIQLVDPLILWNELDGPDVGGVLASTVGADGTIVNPASITYTSADGVDGITVSATGDYGIILPGSVINPTEGSMAVEVNFLSPWLVQNSGLYFAGWYHDNTPIRFGIFHNAGTVVLAAHLNMGGTLQNLNVNLAEDGTFPLPLNTAVNLQVTWDADGIDGSSETIRLYVDGVQVGASTGTGWGTTVSDVTIATVNQSAALNTFVMGDLKIYDKAISTW